MEGYVYIARIIDHGGKFVNGYHKIGLSKQYKVRETQLNSTHLPFDVLMVRVFESEDMKQLEALLHICFEDYRVVKEYDYRKNITTEWFDITDIDIFNDRVDKFVDVLGINEIDMNESIDRDNTLTDEEKEIAKKNVDSGRSEFRGQKRYEFWTKFLNEYKQVDNLFDTINPTRESWIAKRLTGIGGLNCCVTKSSVRVELYIDMYNDKDRNNTIFDNLYKKKELIELELGMNLDWERLDNRRACRISLPTDGNLYDVTQWDSMSQFLVDKMPVFSKVMNKYCKNII